PGLRTFTGMAMAEKYKQLIRVAAVSILFALLLLMINTYFGEPPLPTQPSKSLRMYTPPFLLALCWGVNMAVLRWLQPPLARRFPSRWLNFYLPGYVVLYVLVMILYLTWTSINGPGHS